MEVSFSPSVDGWEYDYRALLCSGKRVVLTAVARGLIQDVLINWIRPVLDTPTAAHLGWFVAGKLRSSGGYWAVRGEDGIVYNGRSGYRIGALEDLWGKFSRNREQLQSFRGLAPSTQEAFFSDAFTRERAQEKTLCGTAAEHIVARFDGGRLIRWSEREPLANV